jgi:hypothetical protein
VAARTFDRLTNTAPAGAQDLVPHFTCIRA